MKLDVPYYSQFADIVDPFWMLRACGAVALKEVAEFHGAIVPDIVALCNEGKDRGGYSMENGWIHDYLVLKAKELGLEAYRKEGLQTPDDVIAYLEKGNPVVISVEKRVLEQKRFHILVLTGYDSVNRLFSYHESESTDKEKGRHRVCDEKTFQEYWRGKAIFIEKRTS